MSAADKSQHEPLLNIGKALSQLARQSDPKLARQRMIAVLRSGDLLGFASTARVLFQPKGELTYHEWLVPHWLWEVCPFPPLGHPFWETGNLGFRPNGIPSQILRLTDVSQISFFDPAFLPIFELRDVRVSADGLRAIEPKPSENAKMGRGRKPGAGGYARADMSLVQRMHDAIEAGNANGPWDATRLVLSDAKGASEDAKKKRLVERYRQCYPDKS